MQDHIKFMNLLLAAWSTPVPTGEVGEDCGEVANATRTCYPAFFAFPCPWPCSSAQVHLVRLRGQVSPCVSRAAVPMNRDHEKERLACFTFYEISLKNLGTG